MGMPPSFAAFLATKKKTLAAMFFAGVVTTPTNKTRLHLFESKKFTNLPNNKALGLQLHTTNPNPQMVV